MPLALFDLDQTLLPYDTQALFCHHVLRAEGWRRGYLALAVAAAPLRALRLIDTRTMKRVFLSYLWRMKPARLTELVNQFARGTVPPLLYPEMLAEIEKHRAAGRMLVLNTASPDIYAPAIAQELGFHHCVATRVRPGRDRMPLVPAIDGPNNKHDEKLKAMRHLLPSELSLPLPGSFAYSDSRADLPMLRMVENPVVVNPDPVLEAVASEENWPILRLPRPQKSRPAFWFDCARQALGCWRPPATASNVRC